MRQEAGLELQGIARFTSPGAMAETRNQVRQGAGLELQGIATFSSPGGLVETKTPARVGSSMGKGSPILGVRV